MHIYLNVHGMLEQLRQKADAEKTRGPRVRQNFWYRMKIKEGFD